MTGVLAAALLAVALADPAFDRAEVIYGRTFGTALTMDVFKPRAKANGAAVLFVVSEGWYSDPAKVAANVPVYVDPLVARGYTVFAVCHGSNPKFALPEIVDHVRRAARYVRHHARGFGVAPDRVGAIGDSAGGHLALMLGCAGRDGDPTAADPVDREASRVRAVAAFFPPTDFLNWGEPGVRMLGTHPTVPVQGAFDFHRPDPATGALRLVTDAGEREAIGRAVSPITHAGRGSAATLVVVGDRDALIPPQQSEAMAAKLKRAGVPTELVVVPGGGHDEAVVRAGMPRAVAWFDEHLADPRGAAGRK